MGSETTGGKGQGEGCPLPSPSREEGADSVDENSVARAGGVHITVTESSVWWGCGAEEVLTAQLFRMSQEMLCP